MSSQNISPSPSSRLKRDPVEQTSEYKSVVNAVDAETREIINALIQAEVDSHPEEEDFIRSLPTSHRFAFEKKRILREKYGIEWKSVIELNPHINFD